ncbi:hypothetical protein D3C72_2365620 [compost metagenome]
MLQLLADLVLLLASVLDRLLQVLLPLLSTCLLAEQVGETGLALLLLALQLAELLL